MNKAIELTRRNVTPAQFLAYVKSRCKAKGMEASISIDLEGLKNPNFIGYYGYTVKDGKQRVNQDGKIFEFDAKDVPCKSEICNSKPYEHQTYFLNFDGTFYNEICEFSFDDEKKGTGYYYMNYGSAEPVAEPVDEPVDEPAAAKRLHKVPAVVGFSRQLPKIVKRATLGSEKALYLHTGEIVTVPGAGSYGAILKSYLSILCWLLPDGETVGERLGLKEVF